MKLQDLVDEIKLEVFACGILESELTDANIKSVVQKEIRELERFLDETTMITVPFASCIDTTNFEHVSIVNVFRASGYGGVEDASNGMVDPVWAQQWMVFSNLGTMYNLQDYLLNFVAWNTMSQIRNTMSSELGFVEDRHTNKLYIHANAYPSFITIEYIPKINDVEEIKSSYWIDVLQKLCVGMIKVIIGRIRTRAKQSGALWEQDGDTLLQEGTEELKELRTKLEENDALCAPLKK